MKRGVSPAETKGKEARREGTKVSSRNKERTIVIVLNAVAQGRASWSVLELDVRSTCCVALRKYQEERGRKHGEGKDG